MMNEFITIGETPLAPSDSVLDNIFALSPAWKSFVTQLDEIILHVDTFDTVVPLTPSASEFMADTAAVRTSLTDAVKTFGYHFPFLVDKARKQPLKKVRAMLETPSGRFLEATAREYVEHNDLPMGVFVLIHDISRYHNTERKQSTFISMVVHELLNPMSPILEGIRLVRDEQVGQLTDVQKHCLSVVEEEATRLARLVNDLLDISRFDCGKIQIQRVPVDVAKLVGSAVNNVNARAIAKNIKMETEISDAVDDVFGDFDRLRQVVINLLENAVKYSPNDTTISLSVSAKIQQVEIRIRDQGYGMSKRDIPRLFERFTQLNYPDHIKSRGKGSGLGLSIVHEIVKLHRGRIKVTSEVNKGSEFVVVLPKRRKGRRHENANTGSR